MHESGKGLCLSCNGQRTLSKLTTCVQAWSIRMAVTLLTPPVAHSAEACTHLRLVGTGAAVLVHVRTPYVQAGMCVYLMSM